MTGRFQALWSDVLASIDAHTPRSVLRGVLLRTPIAARLLHRRYGRRFGDGHYWAANRVAREHHRALAKPPDMEQARAVDELRREGLHQTHFEALLGDDFARFRRASLSLFDTPEFTRQIARRKSRSGVKWYVVRGLGIAGRVRVPPALAKVFLSDRILGIVNAHLGLASRLHYIDVWHNFPVDRDEPSISSETWHGDHEDKRLVKVILYLDDVGADDGPFCFVRRTHEMGALRSECAVSPGQAARPKSEFLSSARGLEHAEVCCGTRGTLLFCDSSGLHRGGRSIRRARVVATATYVSDTAIDRRTRYDISPADASSLADAGRFALRLE
ncbi:MAG: hypothetical protein HKP27_12760 [Myxococcales bacterium]|nr:hypothetical protein [Myxococcales bacterium]